MAVPDDALVIVSSDQGVPLIWQINRDGKRAMVVNFDPAASEFFFSPNFPTLVHGMVTYLSGRTEKLAATYRPSETLPLPGAREGETSKVSAPGDAPVDVTAQRYGPLKKLGFYTIDNQSGRWIAASSLATLRETLLDNAEVKDTTKPLSRGWPPATVLIALAVTLLVIEELLYHRRKVG